MVENYENNTKNGFFIQKWKEGKICKGNYLNNKMNGWGILDNNEINIKGNFFNNILEGYGETYNKEEKITYKGYWEKGLLEGIGQQFNDIFLYEGYFINGKKMDLENKYIKMRMKNMKENGKMIIMKVLEFIIFRLGINI